MSGEHYELYIDILFDEVAVRAMLEGPWGETVVNGQLLARHCPICQAYVPWNSTEAGFTTDAALDVHKDYHLALARLLAKAMGNAESE